jgi:hypothetical protein
MPAQTAIGKALPRRFELPGTHFDVTPHTAGFSPPISWSLLAARTA